MPDYRKKRRNKIFSSPQKVRKSRVKNANESEDIKMSPSKRPAKKTSEKSNMRVITGKKLEQKRRFKVFAATVSVLIIAVIVLQIIFPAGIIRTVSNNLALLGSGSYPIELESSDTLNCVSKGSHYYVLSDTMVYSFAASGKELFSYNHGFENPVIKTSVSGALVFEQGGTGAVIFSLSGVTGEIKTEKEIITAAISDSGNYAIVSRSDKYASTVSVYNKSGKRLYEWYSAQDTVNNAAISPNGKKLAVSTFSANVGQYNSKLRFLEFDSAESEHSESFEGSIVYSLENTGGSKLAVVTKNGVKFIKWSDFKTTDYENGYSAAFFRAGKGGSTAVFNRENDKTDNRIVIFSKKGEKTAEFEFKGIISDIAVYGGHIYCMSDTDIYLLDSSGKILRKASCGFGAVNLCITATNTAVVVTDNKIEKIKLEQ
ncbi:MAG: hypothetical protein IKB45_01715 [Clostridia bacterium]|nr:hypothetical protein [Clostridia bacterium]